METVSVFCWIIQIDHNSLILVTKVCQFRITFIQLIILNKMPFRVLRRSKRVITLVSSDLMRRKEDRQYLSKL